MKKLQVCLLVFVLVLCTTFGCSKRQIIPGVIAGTGGAVFMSGVIYRAALPDEDSEGLFGKQSRQKAVTASLVFTGLALVLAGIIWSATTPVCTVDLDCWRGDVCETKTQTCVPKPFEPSENKETSTSFLLDSLQYDRFRLNLIHDIPKPIPL
ncbi:MAG: hypothetical protein GY854_04685 [Deltaproteobacteria bacterium]|nr:hypothetical protein [Deltaproteobacteria bacterium]